MAWTKEQETAIYKDGTNIIVSAGAGSGKTAVLTERVLEKVKNGISVDNLLILTFTKMAAKEMRERIGDKLKKAGLTSELSKLDTADITTFDELPLHHSLLVPPSSMFDYTASYDPQLARVSMFCKNFRKFFLVRAVFCSIIGAFSGSL